MTQFRAAENCEAKLPDKQAMLHKNKWSFTCGCPARAPITAMCLYSCWWTPDVSAVVFFLSKTKQLARQREDSKSLMSDCVSTKLKFVSVLNSHSECVLHCTLFSSNTQRAPTQPPHRIAKWSHVTTLSISSLFLRCQLASNERCNGSPLLSK